jgi:hypothetical protein
LTQSKFTELSTRLRHTSVTAYDLLKTTMTSMAGLLFRKTKIL